MQNGEATDTSLAKSPEAVKPPKIDEVSKRSIRQKVWKQLETSGLASFPRPVFQRIPNFKGAAEAAELFAGTQAFISAANIFVNPDKPQEHVRAKCVEHKKCLYVPCGREGEGYATRVVQPEGAEPKSVVTRKGMADHGVHVGVDEQISLDLVVMGSVAVSRDGYRIGNGTGYSDLEFALLCHMGAIKPSTLVVTVVHDCQVFDTLPTELFKEQDVPVDLIVTNTQVIETHRTKARPTGILWQLLTPRRLATVSVLTALREKEIQAGKPCPLKEEESEPEERPRPRRLPRQPRRPRKHAQGEEDGDANEKKPRRVGERRGSSKGAETEPKRRHKRPKLDIEFTLKMSNISKNTRVRDIKQALNERGVKPGLMIWKGFRGLCYLHFLKNKKEEDAKASEGCGDSAEGGSPTVESVMEALRELRVREGGAEDGAAYTPTVEPAPPREPASAPPPAPLISPDAQEAITAV